MCRDGCAKCSFRLLAVFNILVMICSLGLIIGLGLLIGNVSFVSQMGLLPGWMLSLGMVGAVFLFITSILGCGTAACTYKQINNNIESSGYDYDNEEAATGGGASKFTSICFLVYLFIVSLFLLLSFGGGVFGASYSASLTGKDNIDIYIEGANNVSMQFADVAVAEFDTLVYNYAPINPTWWYDTQNVLECCGYRSFGTDAKEREQISTSTTERMNCYNRSKALWSITSKNETNAEACAACKTRGTAESTCTSSNSLDQCTRLTLGCPLFTGTECGSDADSCYSKVTDFTKSNGMWISAGLLIFAILLMGVVVSGLSLCFIKCCCSSQN